MTTTHRYQARCTWTGSTGTGYEVYDRRHLGEAPPATAALELASDPVFRGDPSRLNPEQLVVLAASSCQLLSFLAVAARAGPVDEARLRHLVEVAHRQCYIANSLKTAVEVEATFIEAFSQPASGTAGDEFGGQPAS